MRSRLSILGLGGLVLLAACELQEITLVELDPVAVVEIYVNLDADPAQNEIRAFVHPTTTADSVDFDALTRARITVTRSDGFTVPLANNNIEECAGAIAPDDAMAACFLGDAALVPQLRSGDVLQAHVTFEDGGFLSGTTVVPGDFALLDIPNDASCHLQPDTNFRVEWSRSQDAWAYVNETSIRGLPFALGVEGIVVEEDPLYLLGLSVSAQDTTIMFPSEFGIFNRFELDYRVADRLQQGLPDGSAAEVTITAADRNYVNWSRGSNFNPSGQVRVPSLSGDGTGVFASTVKRRFVAVAISAQATTLPACGS